MTGKEQHARGLWEYFRREREAEEETQAGIQGQWHLESSAKEYSEQLYKLSNFGWLVDVATYRHARYLGPSRMYGTSKTKKK